MGPCNQTTPELIAKATQEIEGTGLRKQYKEAVRKKIASIFGSATGVGASGTSPDTDTLHTVVNIAFHYIFKMQPWWTTFYKVHGESK